MRRDKKDVTITMWTEHVLLRDIAYSAKGQTCRNYQNVRRFKNEERRKSEINESQSVRKSYEDYQDDYKNHFVVDRVG